LDLAVLSGRVHDRIQDRLHDIYSRKNGKMPAMTGILESTLWDIDLDNFVVNMADFPFTFWKQLGEAKSKCEHISRAPLLPQTREQINLVYLVRGVHSTTAIEGNTLTEDEVMAIFRKELTLPASRLYQGVEVQNILSAMNEAWKKPLAGPISVGEICALNAQVLAGLEVAEHVVPGEYRRDVVSVGRYRCPDHFDVPRYMESFVNWYNGFLSEHSGLDAVSLAIVKAIASHIYFILIHPFGDGNGRTARLIEWRTLDHAGLASVASHLLSNHYNLTRTRYYDVLDAASRGRDLRPFFCYAVEGLVDQLATQLSFIHDQYATLVYLDMVRARTPGLGRVVKERRQELALGICRAGRPIQRTEVPGLSPVLAALYRYTTERTLSRDLYALMDANLLRWTNDGWLPVTDPMYWRHSREVPNFDQKR
jgi:Fic family protein